MGFCLLNNVAIAAKYIQQKHKLARVLIVDWDVHHGNGTQAVFDEDPTVFYFSVHQSPFYPGTGRAGDAGVGKGLGSKLNVPLVAGCGDAEYKQAFEERLKPAAAAFKPDFVLISAGFDAADGDLLGGMKVTPQGYAEMTRVVKGIAEASCNGRLVSMLEGGYHTEALAASVEAHVRVLMGNAAEEAKPLDARAQKLLAELHSRSFRILYESYRDNNWELMIMNADGSHPMNLTGTPIIDEMFPHASPDGTKVVFVADQGAGQERTRDVYCMNIDGTERVKVGENGRDPFWSPDGKRIAFLRGAYLSYSEGGGANKEIYFYDLETRKITAHPKKDVAGLLNPCWSPDGKWIVASVMGGMGFGHSIIALEANGTKVVELRRSNTEGKEIYQCRPDLSPDSEHVAWGKEDCDHYMWVEVGDLELSAGEPKVRNRRYLVTVPFPLQTYHVDWSPDGQYIAYAQGGRGTKMEPAGYVVGTKAKGWDIWVVTVSEPNVVVQLTHDGLSNKEPDWVVVR